MTKSKTIILSILALFLFSCTESKTEYVTVNDGAFYIGESPYTYMGANYWQGMNLGAPESGDRARLIRDLDAMKANGITNLRIIAASEASEDSKYCLKPALQTAPGVYNEDLWLGLDFFLDEIGKRDMKAVVVLNNFWMWSGGFSQYLMWSRGDKISYPQDDNNWGKYVNYTAQFYSDKKSLSWSKNHLTKVITRTNTVNGKKYNEDPAIMSWQLANEPEGINNQEAYLAWIKNTTDYIRDLDNNHLISLGSEGNTPYGHTGTNVYRDHNFENVDYVTMHIWAQNWSWYSPGDGEEAYQKLLTKVDNYTSKHMAAAKKLNKPIVLEEFGLARDAVNFQATASVTERDRYYEDIFKIVAKSIENNDILKGVNFWAYSGEGRSPRFGEYWQEGDEFLGDPPHELQGWYGVYNTDKSTLDLVKTYSEKIMK